jgi:hypothetical protein
LVAERTRNASSGAIQGGAGITAAVRRDPRHFERGTVIESPRNRSSKARNTSEQRLRVADADRELRAGWGAEVPMVRVHVRTRDTQGDRDDVEALVWLEASG